MDIATTAVVVRRETKTAVLSVDALRALALTAVKNAVDPGGSAAFVDQAATANPADGSITVSLSIETEQVVPAPAPAPAPTVPSLPIPGFGG